MAFSAEARAEDDPFANMSYQDGFNAGVSYAIAALAYKTYGMAETPYPVESPVYKAWDETQHKRIAIHVCVREHMERDLSKGGGAVNMGYKDITVIAKRVFAYCGAERTQAP